jgi:hypothetical protein
LTKFCMVLWGNDKIVHLFQIPIGTFGTQYRGQ